MYPNPLYQGGRGGGGGAHHSSHDSGNRWAGTGNSTSASSDPDEAKGRQALEELRSNKDYIRKRLEYIRGSGRASELYDEVELLQFYLDVMSDSNADTTHGLEGVLGFVNKLTEMKYKNPIPNCVKQEAPKSNEDDNGNTATILAISGYGSAATKLRNQGKAMREWAISETLRKMDEADAKNGSWGDADVKFNDVDANVREARPYQQQWQRPAPAPFQASTSTYDEAEWLHKVEPEVDPISVAGISNLVERRQKAAASHVQGNSRGWARSASQRGRTPPQQQPRQRHPEFNLNPVEEHSSMSNLPDWFLDEPTPTSDPTPYTSYDCYRNQQYSGNSVPRQPVITSTFIPGYGRVSIHSPLETAPASPPPQQRIPHQQYEYHVPRELYPNPRYDPRHQPQPMMPPRPPPDYEYTNHTFDNFQNSRGRGRGRGSHNYSSRGMQRPKFKFQLQPPQETASSFIPSPNNESYSDDNQIDKSDDFYDDAGDDNMSSLSSVSTARSQHHHDHDEKNRFNSQRRGSRGRAFGRQQNFSNKHHSDDTPIDKSDDFYSDAGAGDDNMSSFPAVSTRRPQNQHEKSDQFHFKRGGNRGRGAALGRQQNLNNEHPQSQKNAVKRVDINELQRSKPIVSANKKKPKPATTLSQLRMKFEKERAGMFRLGAQRNNAPEPEFIQEPDPVSPVINEDENMDEPEELATATPSSQKKEDLNIDFLKAILMTSTLKKTEMNRLLKNPVELNKFYEKIQSGVNTAKKDEKGSNKPTPSRASKKKKTSATQNFDREERTPQELHDDFSSGYGFSSESESNGSVISNGSTRSTRSAAARARKPNFKRNPIRPTSPESTSPVQKTSSSSVVGKATKSTAKRKNPPIGPSVSRKSLSPRRKRTIPLSISDEECEDEQEIAGSDRRGAANKNSKMNSKGKDQGKKSRIQQAVEELRNENKFKRQGKHEDLDPLEKGLRAFAGRITDEGRLRIGRHDIIVNRNVHKVNLGSEYEESGVIGGLKQEKIEQPEAENDEDFSDAKSDPFFDILANVEVQMDCGEDEDSEIIKSSDQIDNQESTTIGHAEDAVNKASVSRVDVEPEEHHAEDHVMNVVADTDMDKVVDDLEDAENDAEEELNTIGNENHVESSLGQGPAQPSLTEEEYNAFLDNEEEEATNEDDDDGWPAIMISSVQGGVVSPNQDEENRPNLPHLDDADATSAINNEENVESNSAQEEEEEEEEVFRVVRVTDEVDLSDNECN